MWTKLYPFSISATVFYLVSTSTLAQCFGWEEFCLHLCWCRSALGYALHSGAANGQIEYEKHKRLEGGRHQTPLNTCKNIRLTPQNQISVPGITPARPEHLRCRRPLKRRGSVSTHSSTVQSALRHLANGPAPPPVPFRARTASCVHQDPAASPPERSSAPSGCRCPTTCWKSRQHLGFLEAEEQQEAADREGPHGVAWA